MSLLKPLRKTFFWLHLAGGLTAGLLILLMAVTGFLLMYERQILEWQDGYKVRPSAHAADISLEKTVAAVSAAHPGPALTSITREVGANEPFVFGFGKERTLYVHPHTGEVLGEGAPRLRGFFEFVTGLHRWLALQNDQRELGKTITGVACLFFLFLVLSGLLLWWPRHWSWISLKRIILFQPRMHGPARDWNWHNVIGFWCCIPLFIITTTGLVIAFPWANDLLYRLSGTEPPPPRAAGGGKGTGGPPSAVSFTGLDKAWEIARDKVPGWQSINLRLPASAAAPATFTISESHRGRPDLKSQLMVKLGTGEVTAWETFSTYNRGKQWRFWVRWLHTGEAGGFFGQTLAGVAATGAVFLVWTGFALSWRRFTKKKARKGS